MSKRRYIPKLTLHKATGQAVVRLSGKDHYCGRHSTAAAQVKYHRLIAEWIAAGSDRPIGGQADLDPTIAQVVDMYWPHALRRYRKNGRPTSEVLCQKSALKFLLKLYPDLSAADFGPLRLQAVRQSMIDAGRARRTINKDVGRIRRLFAWAGSMEIIDPLHSARLKCLEGLRYGQGGREIAKPTSVVRSCLEQIRPHISRQIWTMVELQWHTGMRSGEVTSMRTCDLDATGRIWEYRPAEYKTQHRQEDTCRIIPIGPQAQGILKPWLRPALEDYLFQPIEAEAARGQQLRRRCQSRPPGRRYTPNTYRQAIQRACRKAGIAPWTPHQLRHSYATRVRKEFGLDAARAALGHVDANVTLDYAELDRQKAVEVARKIG